MQPHYVLLHGSAPEIVEEVDDGQNHRKVANNTGTTCSDKKYLTSQSNFLRSVSGRACDLGGLRLMTPKLT